MKPEAATEAAVELWIGSRLAAGEFEDEDGARSAFWRRMRARKDHVPEGREAHQAMDLITAVTALAAAAARRGETLLLAGVIDAERLSRAPGFDWDYVRETENNLQ